MNNSIADRAVDDKIPVIFSLAIDATKVAKQCEVSSTYKAVIGGAHPNHKVDVSCRSDDNINVIFDGTSNYMKLEEEYKVKVAIM